MINSDSDWSKNEEENQQLQSDLKVVTDKLNGDSRGPDRRTRKQNKMAAVTYGKKLDELGSNVNAQLATKASTEDVTKIGGDVSGVKTDLDATKNSIQMARSEMGTLIARNHDEIDQLRRMGQRDYYEFTVTRKAGAQKVGTIQVQLKDSNPKKNQFSIIVLADEIKSFERSEPFGERAYFLLYRRNSPGGRVGDQQGQQVDGNRLFERAESGACHDDNVEYWLGPVRVSSRCDPG